MYSRGAFPSLSPTGYSLSKSSVALLVLFIAVCYIITSILMLVKSPVNFSRFYADNM